MKKVFVAFATLLAVAASKPAEIFAPISSQYHTQDNLGQYTYGYTDEHSSKVEVKTLDGVTRGGYNYIDAEGKLQSVQYTSDENGFQVDATNLPVAPAAHVLQSQESPTARTQQLETKSQDTIEVEAAAPVAIQQISQTPIAPATIPIPPAVRIESPALLAPLPIHTIAPLATVRVAAPGIAYSYGIPTSSIAYSSYTTHPLQAHFTYTAPVISAPLAAPVDTPEVAKARAEHLAAVEEAKARHA